MAGGFLIEQPDMFHIAVFIEDSMPILENDPGECQQPFETLRGGQRLPAMFCLVAPCLGHLRIPQAQHSGPTKEKST